MLVDYEALLLDLKAAVIAKNSHGQRDLLGLIARLEVEHRVEEGLPERAIRLYGQDLQEALTGSSREPATEVPVGDNGHGSYARSLSDSPSPKEDTHARDADAGHAGHPAHA